MSTTRSPLIAEILAGDHDADLDRIDRAVRRRKQTMFRPGTRVAGVGGRIDGEEGIVVKVNLKRVSVDFDNLGSFLVPVDMLEVVS